VEHTVVKYPWMRDELTAVLKSLSSREYQEKYWIGLEFDEKVKEDNFDLSVHFLYDDTELSEAPERTVGIILKDENEVVAIRRLVRAIDVVFERYGLNLSDAQYLQKPEWKAVIDSARDGLRVIKV
jgi:hypothetical protein